MMGPNGGYLRSISRRRAVIVPSMLALGVRYLAFRVNATSSSHKALVVNSLVDMGVLRPKVEITETGAVKAWLKHECLEAKRCKASQWIK